MFEEIQKVIQSNELCTMRLIHQEDIMYIYSQTLRIVTIQIVFGNLS